MTTVYITLSIILVIFLISRIFNKKTIICSHSNYELIENDEMVNYICNDCGKEFEKFVN